MNKEIKLKYTNWRGETRTRSIIPITCIFGATKYHKEKQWLLTAVDPEDNNVVKLFALKDCDFINNQAE